MAAVLCMCVCLFSLRKQLPTYMFNIILLLYFISNDHREYKTVKVYFLGCNKNVIYIVKQNDKQLSLNYWTSTKSIVCVYIKSKKYTLCNLISLYLTVERML